MAIPSRATGYGNNSTARYVFSATFSTALSTNVTYEMYDNNGVGYPAVDTSVTSTKVCFSGTAGNGWKPVYSLVDTTNAAPVGAWKPAGAAGSANPNRMSGLSKYVTQAGAIRDGGANTRISWNEVLELPSDWSSGINGLLVDLLLRYTYTGSAPVVAWYFNDLIGGGTEGAPVWTVLTPGAHGVRHCRAGVVPPNYVATVPASSTQDTTEGWVSTN